MKKKGTYLELETLLKEMQLFPCKSQKLSTPIFYVLSMFSAYECLSVYNVYDHLRKRRKIAYKNVGKTVHRLALLKLIALVEGPKLEAIKKSWKYVHKPTFYELTLGGMFNLLSAGSSYIGAIIFEFFPNSIFLKVFLDPLFERRTINEIKRTLFLKTALIRYLTDCCKIIERYELVYKSICHDEVSYTVDLDTFEIDDHQKFLSFIEHGLNLRLTNPKITQIDDRLITFSTPEDTVSIEFDRKSKKHWIRLNNLIELKVRTVTPPVNDVIKVSREKKLKEILDPMWNEIQHAMVIFAFSFMLTVTSAEGTFSRQAKSERALLSSDKKFSRFLENVFRMYQQSYEEFAGSKAMK